MTTERAIDAFYDAWFAAEQSKYLTGFIGKLDSSAPGSVVIDVPGRTGYVYVRVSNGVDTFSVMEAFNKGAIRNPNIKVRIERRPTGWVIVDADESSAIAVLGEHAAAAGVPPHSHSIASGNVDMVEGRRFLPGLLRPATGAGEPGGLYVYVEEFSYDGGYWSGGSFEMTPPSTSGKHAWCMVALNPSDGALYQLTGDEYATPLPLAPLLIADIAVPTGYIPVGAVVLENGQTAITGTEKWNDCRYHFAQAGGDIGNFVALAPDSDTRNVVQPAGDHPALIVKNNAAQVDNIFEHKSSAGTTLTSIAPTGNVTAPAVTATSLDINGDGAIRKLLTDASTELTIASGAITVTQTFHRIDTEADAASDDLDTINGGADGQFLVIRAENAGREVVVTTAGNITTSDGNNVSLDEVYKFLLLIYDGNRSKWNVVGGGGGGGSGSYYQTVKDNGTPLTQRAALNLIGGTDITVTVADDSGNNETDVTIAYAGAGGGSTPYSLCQGRLTLTSGTPVTTSDVTAATTLYFTPYKGNQIGLYNGSAWEMKTFSELSLSLSGYTADKNYDIWAYNNSGTVTLESTVWTDNTTRATALTTQDGVYVKSGATTRRYLGTIRITGTTGQTEDSEAKRYVWNYYNREHRALRRLETTDNWTYSSTTVRQANNNTSNQVNVVIGVAETMVSLFLGQLVRQSGATAVSQIGIGYDSTTAYTTGLIATTGLTPAANAFHFISTSMTAYPAIGYHYYAWLESGHGSGTNTWYSSDGISRAHGLMGFMNA